MCECRDRIVNGGGEAVLGCKPVIDGHDPYAGMLGQETAYRVVALNAAQDKSAPVEVEQQWSYLGCIGRFVYACTQWALGAANGDVANADRTANPGADDAGGLI